MIMSSYGLTLNSHTLVQWTFVLGYIVPLLVLWCTSHFSFFNQTSIHLKCHRPVVHAAGVCLSNKKCVSKKTRPGHGPEVNLSKPNEHQEIRKRHFQFCPGPANSGPGVGVSMFFSTDVDGLGVSMLE